MSAPTSRRAVICGAGLSAMAVAASAMASTPVATAAGVSPNLIKLIAAADAARRASESFDADVYDTSRDRAFALIEAIPHTAVDIDGDPYWTTANPGSVRVAQSFVTRDPQRLSPDIKQLRNLVAASHRRDREAARIRKASGLSAAIERSNAMGDATAEAEWAVATFACQSASDLLAKLTFMTARSMDDGIAVLEYILPDAARLAGAEGR